MAVRFLLGVAGSGKTHHCLAGLRAAEAEARVAMYIVPEQFTYSADRELLEGSGLPGLRHTRVLSFSRLATWLEERSDEASPPTLDPAVRPMVLRAALARLEPGALGPLAPFRHRPGFLDELSRFVSEIRNHGMVDFLAALERGERSDIAPGVRAKLRALGRAFDSYEGVLHELRRQDPEERLARLPGLIARQTEELRGVSIWVDGFLSWTRRERDALVALALAGANLEIALCLDPAEASPRAPFLPIARSRRLLEGVLRSAAIELEPPVVFPARPRFHAPALAALEANLLSDQPRPANGSEVALLTATDRRQEVQLWARTIDRWLRVDARTALPREIAVLVRDIEPYREAVHEIFPRYRIPYFLDERRSVIAHPRIRFLLGAFEVILSGWKRASVISWLRSPFLGNAPATVDLLENLSLAAGHNFEAWHAPRWPDDPLLPRERRWRAAAPEAVFAEASGAEADESEADGDEHDALESEAEEPRPELSGDIGLVEPTRRRCLLPLRALELAWGSGLTGPEVQRALRTHLGPLVCPVPGEDLTWEARVEEALENLIAEAALIWRDVPVSLDDFARTLREGLRALRLGVTPVRLDEVSVGDVRRSRLQGIRYAIVGGLTDGAFPRAVPDGPVVNELDRAALAALGAPLGPTASEQQEEETYLFYIALTRCSEQLILTYATSDTLGAPLGPSLLLSEVERALPTLVPVPPPVLVENGPMAAVQTMPELEATLTRMAAQSGAPGPLLDLLRATPAGDEPAPPVAGGAWGDLLERLERRVADGEFEPESTATHLDAEVREALYGRPELLSSVSRLESYARCPYQHFAGSVLKLAPRIVAEVSAIETGLLAHAALELFFKQETLVSLAEVPTALAAVFKRLEKRSDLRAFQVDPAARHRWTSTERSLARFLDLELQRLEGSRFRPHAFEVGFGPESGNPVELPLPDGGTLLLRGRIDRIDLSEGSEGPEGVVLDYKRSAKSGVLREWNRGGDLQLAAYLLFMRQRLEWTPVAGLYVPVIPAPVREEDRAQGANPARIRYTGAYPLDRLDDLDAGTQVLSSDRRSSVPSQDGIETLLETATEHLASYGATMRQGWIEPRPVRSGTALPCDHCDFLAVCRFRSDRDPVRGAPRESMVEIPGPRPAPDGGGE